MAGSPAALPVPISPKWHNAMTPLLSRFLIPSLPSMTTRLPLRTTIRERLDDTTGTPESCRSNGRKEWRSELSRVTSQDRPGAQKRHRKGPRLLGPTPARGGSSYRGRNSVPRYVASPSCRRVLAVRRAIRAEGDHVRSAERSRQRPRGVGEGQRLATRSSRWLRMPACCERVRTPHGLPYGSPGSGRIPSVAATSKTGPHSPT
jgi:hypothetical protein